VVEWLRHRSHTMRPLTSSPRRFESYSNQSDYMNLLAVGRGLSSNILYNVSEFSLPSIKTHHHHTTDKRKIAEYGENDKHKVGHTPIRLRIQIGWYPWKGHKKICSYLITYHSKYGQYFLENRYMYFMSNAALLKIFNTMLFPHFTYCCTIYM
jgi:hypothetical protein